MSKSLFKFQEETVDTLLNNPKKHIVVAGVGCFAKGTPVRMADGSTKQIDKIKSGDKVWAYDENKQITKIGEVSSVFRVGQNPKPMIEFTYNGETIRSTYDHPYFNGEGYYPLYQLIWGALETSQRAQLKLLCKQYGQAFDYKAIRCKHCSSNEASQGQGWALQDYDGWANRESAQNSSGELARKSQQLAMCKPYQFESERQSSGESGMVHLEIQCVVGLLNRKDKKPKGTDAQQIIEGRQAVCEKSLSGFNKKHGTYEGGESGESGVLRQNAKEIPEHIQRDAERLGLSRVKVMEAEPYYAISLKRAPYTYFVGEKHCFIVHNTGKTAISMVWAQAKCLERGLNKVLVITTASKSKTKNSLGRNDFELEADDFCTPSFRQNLVSFETVSWNSLHKWVDANRKTLREWVVIADEVQRIKGHTSRMAKSFLKIAYETQNWVGFTGTPGDYWISYGAYFQACKLITTKTHYTQRFCIIQTFKGFPEIIGYREEETLKKWWTEISYAPDTSKIAQELPKATHKVVYFPKPKGYDKVLKMRQKLCEDGSLSEDYEDFLDNPSKTFHYLRQLCFTKEKQQWLSDFIEGLGENCIFFYNYTATADEIERIAKKVLPKGAKVWRIDGSHHKIPTKDTIGKYDIVLSQWQSGSEGLNLQFMHVWVSVELTYAYSTAQQARGRILRRGQTKNCLYYYLQTEGTIERDIMKCLKNKGEFSEKVWLLGNGLIKEKDEY